MKRAEHAPELLDEPEHDANELARSLEHVAQVNRWLGGSRALLKHLAPFLPDATSTSILDVGTGSADLPREIVAWARSRKRSVKIRATDLHPQMQALAADRCAAYPEITVEAADALALPYEDKSFDVTLLSLTLHHFDGPAQTRVLTEAKRVSRRAVIVNELLRSRLNYLGARLLAASWWRANRLTRHDGPLSVLRAFEPEELVALAREAGLTGRVYREFFQRIVLVAPETSL